MEVHAKVGPGDVYGTTRIASSAWIIDDLSLIIGTPRSDGVSAEENNKVLL